MSKNINIEDIEKCNDIISSNIEQANNENSYNTTTTNSNNISIVINNFDDKCFILI